MNAAAEQHLHTHFNLPCICPSGPASKYPNAAGDNDHNLHMKGCESPPHLHEGCLVIQTTPARSELQCLSTSRRGEQGQNGMSWFSQPHQPRGETKGSLKPPEGFPALM